MLQSNRGGWRQDFWAKEKALPQPWQLATIQMLTVGRGEMEGRRRWLIAKETAS